MDLHQATSARDRQGRVRAWRGFTNATAAPTAAAIGTSGVGAVTDVASRAAKVGTTLRMMTGGSTLTTSAPSCVDSVAGVCAL